MRRLSGCAALLAAIVLAATSGAASAVPVPSLIESGTSNPVTAAPPTSVPPTRHCTVTLADGFMSNAPDGTPQTYSGSLAPPTACAGPWAKVVLTHDISVSGRQYDRVDTLRIGGAEVYHGTTEEPSGPTPTAYSFSTDITEFSSLLRTAQPFSGGIGNYTSDVYTGNYQQTTTITYYLADRRHPAPDVPDRVVGLGDDSLTPGTPTADHALTDLPRNLTRAKLQVTMEGGGCDEQWFSDVPDAVAQKYAAAGMCGHGPFRETEVSLDGQPAAALGTFPHIYSGGIVPTLWRPIPAIGTFALRSESVDLTPFVGALVDGGSHTLRFTVQDNGDNWQVAGNLFLWTDHHASRTHGALTRDTVAPTATEDVATTDAGDGTRVVDRVGRRDVLSGWVQTSAGRVTTTVTRTRDYRNDDLVTDGGLTQHIEQSDGGSQTVSTALHGRVTQTRHTFAYPITVDYSAAAYVDDQNFSLTGTVDMTQRLEDAVTTGRHWRVVGSSAENVTSSGVLARTGGVTSESDGHSTSYFIGTDDRGRPFRHYLASDHGIVTKDVVSR